MKLLDTILYDRQIRTYGLDACEKILLSSVLVINLSKGLGTEICKNLMLSGVNTIYLFDNEIIKSYETPQVIDYPKPGNNEKTNVSNQFEKVQNERETLYPKQEKIDFSIKADDKNNTVDLYNDLLGTYNKQLQSMENFENENKDKNNTISELENIDQLNYELSK